MRICVSSSSSLLYIDHKKHPHEATWLYCSKSPPELRADANITHVQQDNVWDMCCVQDRNKHLLLTTGGFDGVSAYNTDTDQIEWCKKGTLAGMEEQMMAEGVTTDGCGHVFISDESNGCIHVLSNKGFHLGVLKEGEQGLGRSRLIHWCNEASSLVVAHIIDEQYCISKIETTMAPGMLHEATTGKNPDDDTSKKMDEGNEDASSKTSRKQGTKRKSTASDGMKGSRKGAKRGETDAESQMAREAEAESEGVGKSKHDVGSDTEVDEDMGKSKHAEVSDVWEAQVDADTMHTETHEQFQNGVLDTMQPETPNQSQKEALDTMQTETPNQSQKEALDTMQTETPDQSQKEVLDTMQTKNPDQPQREEVVDTVQRETPDQSQREEVLDTMQTETPDQSQKEVLDAIQTETPNQSQKEVLDTMQTETPDQSQKEVLDTMQTETLDQSLTEEDVDKFLEALTEKIPTPRKKSSETDTSRTYHIDVARAGDIDRASLEHSEDPDVKEDSSQADRRITMKKKPPELSTSAYVKKLLKCRTKTRPDDVIVIDSPQTDKTSQSKRKGRFLHESMDSLS